MPEEVEEVVDTVRVEVADVPEGTMTLVGLREGVGPAGETVAAKLTGPLKPLMLVTVMVAVPDEPWRNVMEEGFDAIVKSGVGAAWTTKVPTM